MITTYIIPPVRDSIVCDQRNSDGGREKVGVAASKIDDNFPLLGIYLCTDSSSLDLTNLYNLQILRGISITFPYICDQKPGVFFHENSEFRSLKNSLNDMFLFHDQNV